jgi:hypothetical protein
MGYHNGKLLWGGCGVFLGVLGGFCRTLVSFWALWSGFGRSSYSNPAAPDCPGHDLRSLRRIQGLWGSSDNDHPTIRGQTKQVIWQKRRIWVCRGAPGGTVRVSIKVERQGFRGEFLRLIFKVWEVVFWYLCRLILQYVMGVLGRAGGLLGFGDMSILKFDHTVF